MTTPFVTASQDLAPRRELYASLVTVVSAVNDDVTERLARVHEAMSATFSLHEVIVVVHPSTATRAQCEAVAATMPNTTFVASAAGERAELLAVGLEAAIGDVVVTADLRRVPVEEAVRFAVVAADHRRPVVGAPSRYGSRRWSDFGHRRAGVLRAYPRADVHVLLHDFDLARVGGAATRRSSAAPRASSLPYRTLRASEDRHRSQALRCATARWRPATSSVVMTAAVLCLALGVVVEGLRGEVSAVWCSTAVVPLPVAWWAGRLSQRRTAGRAPSRAVAFEVVSAKVANDSALNVEVSARPGAGLPAQRTASAQQVTLPRCP